METPASDIIWIMLCSVLVFIMQPGFLCLESGFTRSKNNINVAVKNIADFGVSTFLFWLIGFSLMFGVEQKEVWSLMAQGNLDHQSAWTLSVFIFQAMFCATAVTIVSGAIAERVRFSSYIMLCILLTLGIYPIFGSWVWGSLLGSAPGWLESRGFVDFAGSTVVHSVGGWAALAALMVIGPRVGRFSKEGMIRHMTASNMPFAMLGTLLLVIGWLYWCLLCFWPRAFTLKL